MPDCAIILHAGLVFHQKCSMRTPLFDDVGAGAGIREKRDAIFLVGSTSLRGNLNCKVGVALFFIFAEGFLTKQMPGSFGGLWCHKLNLRVTL